MLQCFHYNQINLQFSIQTKSRFQLTASALPRKDTSDTNNFHNVWDNFSFLIIWHNTMLACGLHKQSYEWRPWQCWATLLTPATTTSPTLLTRLDLGWADWAASRAQCGGEYCREQDHTTLRQSAAQCDPATSWTTQHQTLITLITN